VSARFPKCHNVEEFWNNLLKEKDMLGDSNHRWNENCPDILKKVGTIPDVSKFDPGFFGMHSRQAHNMDPLIRQLLEVAVEAVVDGGVHPSELKGTKTGVFVGCSWSESEEIFMDKFVECQQFRLTGYKIRRNLLQ
jgi:fatty acid synthase